MTWHKGDRVIVRLRNEHEWRRITTPVLGEVTGVDTGPVPGVEVRFINPLTFNGLTGCYATHTELEAALPPEPADLTVRAEYLARLRDVQPAVVNVAVLLRDARDIAEAYLAVRDAGPDALRAAAQEVRRVRTEGLRDGEDYGPSSKAFEEWLLQRAGDVTGDHRPDPESCAEKFGWHHFCLLDPGHKPPHQCACGYQSDGTPAPAVPADTIHRRDP